MGAARRFASARLAAFVVCAGGVLLAVPTAGLAADWTPSSESVTGKQRRLERRHGPRQLVEPDGRLGRQRGDRDERANGGGASWGSASSVSVDAGATAPDFAESLGTQLATWVGSDGNVSRGDRTAEAWVPASLPLTTSGAASSPQAAIVNGVPTVFWIDGNTIESSTWNGLAWSAPASPLSAPLAAGTISDLRVSIVGYGRSRGLAPNDGRQRRHGADRALAPGRVTSNSPAVDHRDCRRGRRERQWPRRGRLDGADVGHAGRSLDLGWRVHARGRRDRRVGEPAGRRHLLGRPGVRRVGVGWIGAGEIRSAGGTWGSETSLGSGAAPSVSAGLVGRRRRQLARLDPRVRRIAPVGDGRPAELAPGPRIAQLVRDDLGRLVGSRAPPPGASTTTAAS